PLHPRLLPSTTLFRSRADAAREIDVVDVNPDAGLEVEREIALTDTADIRGQHRARAAERHGRVDIDVRREIGNLRDLRDRAQIERDAGGDGHRDRHVLRVLVAALSGDADLLEAMLIYARRARSGGRHWQQGVSKRAVST